MSFTASGALPRSDVLAEMDGVGKIYHAAGVAVHALTDVHLRLRRGEFVAVSGPSGGGKTTLLNLLALLDLPTRGTYRFDGAETTRLSGRARAALRAEKIGVVFQSFNLVDELTVAQNVELPLVHRGLAPADCTRRAMQALERVEMEARIHHYPDQLSGGQQQRVAIARAVAGSPSLLLADEPTGNLDSTNGDVVMGILRDLHREGTTVCIVTHDPRYARHAERTAQLFDGRIAGEHADA